MNNSSRPSHRVTLPGALLGYVGLSLSPATAHANPVDAAISVPTGSDPPIADQAAIAVDTVSDIAPGVAAPAAMPDWSDAVPLVPAPDPATPAIAVDVVPTVAAPEVITVEAVRLETSNLSSAGEGGGGDQSTAPEGAPVDQRREASGGQEVPNLGAETAAIAPPAEDPVAGSILVDSTRPKPKIVFPSSPETMDLGNDPPEPPTAIAPAMTPVATVSPGQPESSQPESSPIGIGEAPSAPSVGVEAAVQVPTTAAIPARSPVGLGESSRPVQRTPLTSAETVAQSSALAGSAAIVPPEIAPPEIAPPDLVVPTAPAPQLSQSDFGSAPLAPSRDQLDAPLRLPPSPVELSPDSTNPDLDLGDPPRSPADGVGEPLNPDDPAGGDRPAEADWDALTVEQRQQIQRLVILDALSVGNDRYPAIIDPTDNYTFEAGLYRPRTEENYGQLDFRLNQNSPTLEQLTYGHYPQEDQFYWVLPGNRVVLETVGWVGGLRYQGRTTGQTLSQEVTQVISLWGLQAVWNVPQRLDDPSNLDALGITLQDLQQADVQTIAGQLTSESGNPGVVILDSGIDLTDPNTVDLNEFLSNPPGLTETETFAGPGGRSLFENLEDPRTPVILQAFPTNDLSGLASDGRLREGNILSPEGVAEAGIQFANVLTGAPAVTALRTTSTPGIKFARLGEFDNIDLLNVLVNPDLTGTERDRRYLNSLYWTGFIRSPDFETLAESSSREDWYQFYVSRPHNRAMIAYDSAIAAAEYTDIFANPGLSVTFSFEGESDGGQSLNATLGLALGGLFEPADHNDLNDYLAEAYYRYDQGDRFADLQTGATPEQRRAINRRLNRTLNFANFNSGINQTSGRITFESEITPDTSTALQLRTGLHQRRAQVIGLEQELLIGDIEVTELDLSSETFGPLTFTSTPVTEERLPGTRAESFAAEVTLITPSGRRLVQRYSTADQTSVPLGVVSADLAFDRIELTRIDQLDSKVEAYRGILNLPAVELSRSGSDGIWNYSVNAGVWVNLDENEAPGVGNNTVGAEEPGAGLYINTFANAIQSEVRLDENQQPIAVVTYGPTWRSEVDTTGDISAVLSYEYAEQGRDRGWSVRPGVAYVRDNDDSDWIAFLTGQLSLPSGWSFRSTVELQDDLFIDIDALKRLDDRWAVGGYLRNYIVESTGLQERNAGFNTGVTVRYTFARSNSFLEGRFGGGEDGFDAQVQGGFRF